jgi:hypothetical protein
MPFCVAINPAIHSIEPVTPLDPATSRSRNGVQVLQEEVKVEANRSPETSNEEEQEEWFQFADRF